MDLSRICEASGVGAEFRIVDLPAGPRALPEEVLGGGEDYELIATLPGTHAVAAAARELDDSYAIPLTEIGLVVDGEGLTAIASDGARRRVDPSGWNHFA